MAGHVCETAECGLSAVRCRHGAKINLSHSHSLSHRKRNDQFQGGSGFTLMINSGHSRNVNSMNSLLSISGGSCHKYHFCRDTCLSRQNTSFVATKVCLSRQNFCRNKHIFVATKLLSRQKYCHDKLTFVTTNTSFVATKVCLS